MSGSSDQGLKPGGTSQSCGRIKKVAPGRGPFGPVPWGNRAFGRRRPPRRSPNRTAGKRRPGVEGGTMNPSLSGTRCESERAPRGGAQKDAIHRLPLHPGDSVCLAGVYSNSSSSCSASFDQSDCWTVSVIPRLTQPAIQVIRGLPGRHGGRDVAESCRGADRSKQDVGSQGDAVIHVGQTRSDGNHGRLRSSSDVNRSQGLAAVGSERRNAPVKLAEPQLPTRSPARHQHRQRRIPTSGRGALKSSDRKL